MYNVEPILCGFPMKFILITGNPNADEDLVYHALRKGRFTSPSTSPSISK